MPDRLIRKALRAWKRHPNETLLVLLVIVRMFILIYQDLTPMRFGVPRAVSAPAR